ncbi:hypothetical protein [Streptomyces sp. ME109]|uniref:hypothetical protein n=1 Tax=Streptomyces sp. me109 TaxID=1827853 RepID=UPI0021C78F2C|nr:hypothetical protein [Streptomyces sp. me109]
MTPPTEHDIPQGRTGTRPAPGDAAPATTTGTVWLPESFTTAPEDGASGIPASVSAPPVPHLTHGLRTLGEYQGSGFTDRRYVVRRGDGQVLLLSRLLYLVVSSIDGTRDTETISHRVCGRYGSEVTAENIAYLVDNRLTPLGVTVPLGRPAQECEEAPRSDLLLSLRGHRVIFNEARVARIASALSWLHRPWIVALALAGTAAVDIWLFAVHGAMTPLLQVLEQPLWMLAVFLLTVASLLFHEFGHASACRYSGAVPGKIGCGIYLIWPALYTDVTDVYRINRGGRLRTGLGGVYFNAVFMLVLAACYLLTDQPFFLASVYLAHFEILEQLMPALRLDGYYILGDLAGVPDLFGKVKPILLSLLPGRAPAETVGLKRSARTIVATWVLTMIPLLIAEAAYALWNLPRIVTTAFRGLVDQSLGTIDAFGAGHPAAGTVGVIGALMLACPMVGGAYLIGRVLVRLVRAALKATQGKPALRLALGAASCVGVCALAAAWWQGMTPEPLPRSAPAAPLLQPGVPRTGATESAHAPRPTGSPAAPPSPDPLPVRHPGAITAGNGPETVGTSAPPTGTAGAHPGTPPPSTARTTSSPSAPHVSPPGATSTVTPSTSPTASASASSAPPSVTASPSTTAPTSASPGPS